MYPLTRVAHITTFCTYRQFMSPITRTRILLMISETWCWQCSITFVLILLYQHTKFAFIIFLKSLNLNFSNKRSSEINSNFLWVGITFTTRIFSMYFSVVRHLRGSETTLSNSGFHKTTNNYIDYAKLSSANSLYCSLFNCYSK